MKDNTITALVQPGEYSDHLTDVLGSGAQALLAHAVEAEVAGFLEHHEQERLGDGRARLVRHGHLPEREIQTGIGAVSLKQPRVRDRSGKGADQLRLTVPNWSHNLFLERTGFASTSGNTGQPKFLFRLMASAMNVMVFQ